jgi:hypothetical protein
MELISQRVAACLPVKPNRISKRAQDPRDATGQSDIGARDDGRVQSPADQGQGVDWKKWGARAAIGKGWAGEGKRLVTGGQV